jgi:hypothetical protein
VFFFTKGDDQGVSLNGYAKKIEQRHEERLRKTQIMQEEFLAK